MKKFLQFLIVYSLILSTSNAFAQLNNNCSNAINVCNNQLSEQLDDGPGTQECPTGGCGCMLAGEKNTRWFRITVATAGTLEFTIRPYNGTADYDFSVWNQDVGGTCPTGGRLALPDRCNFAAPQSPTGIKGTGNNNANGASGSLFSNEIAVTAGQVIYILVDNYDGTQEGFYLDFFGGAAGSGTGTTATFDCSSINTCTSCLDSDCKSYLFNSSGDYTFDETAANGACHSNFGFANTKTAKVCGTFTVPAPHNTVEFPLNRGYEVTTTNGANSTTCLNSAVITYSVWDNCASAPLIPNPGTGIYTGLNNVTTYKVCKTITVTDADCWLGRVCLPYWTMVQNDVICNAASLIVDAAPIAGTNAGASSDLDAGCTGYQDVYYKFVAPASGRVQVNVVPNATSDVKVSVIGPMAGIVGGVNDCNLSCTQLGESNVVAGCNDDAGSGGTERLFTFVIPGQTYYIWISGTLFNPTAGFTVQVVNTITNTANPIPGPDIVGAPDPIPSNDQCANATNLNLCVALPSSNIGATAECTDPDPQYLDAITLENDVWYKWTAPANNGNSEVTLTVTGISCTSGVDGGTGIQFGIFEGTCASLTPISQGTTSVTFTPIPGTTYYFVIDGNAGAQCNFTIQVKRPVVSSQTCNTAAACAGSSLNASMGITYYGSNPGTKWAYCKSGTFGSACTIDLDNPATYFVYKPAQGLPDPGCTPATYTFVGYILADNGVTKIPGYPTYPLPQPLTASCLRQTNACTFNIYPDIKNTVTVTNTNCSQVVTLNGTCSPTAPVTLTGNTNQTIASPPGGSGTFTPVTVTWNAPYAAAAPAQCSTYIIQNTYNCLGASGANSCATAPMLTLGIPQASNNNVARNTNEQVPAAVSCNNNYGSGVWFTFIAPNSGNVNINLTNIGVGDDLTAMIYLFDSRQWADDGTGILYPQSDVCSSCSDMSTPSGMYYQWLYCLNAGAGNTTGVIPATNLNPGETYYIMVDGYNYNASNAALRTGNFTITVVDAGGGPVRPVNDNICNAVDLTTSCSPQPANNFNATSLCSGDPAFPSGASTENSVWYTYTATITGPTTIKYLYATGTFCAGQALNPGVQFALYTSSNNACSGTLTNIPAGSVYSGTTSGQVTVNLTAGQKYYILVDGYAGNECKFEFQIYNGNSCCTADLGATEGTDKILCFGDDVTYGVTANPIDFGANVQNNPVIGWQLSTTQPTVINPFDPANNGKNFLIGKVDTITGGGARITGVYHDAQGNYPSPDAVGVNATTTNFPIILSGFSGSTFNSATDTISVCVNLAEGYFSDLTVSLVAPNGVVFPLMTGQCGAQQGYIDVCFSNVSATGTISSFCPVPATGVGELTGYLAPITAWSALNGVPLNGTWNIRIKDAGHPAYQAVFYASSIEIKKPHSTYVPGIRTTHGDLHIVNNDPYKYGQQVFWLTPITFVNYNGSTLTSDSCYSYGTPVKVTLLEKVTTPLVAPTCAAPGDGSNGITLTVTSPTGGMPGLPVPTVADTFTVIGAGAASGIKFPTRPVGESEVSSSFPVANGQAWNVRFVDHNGCESEISGTYNQPNPGSVVLDTNVCDGATVAFSTSNPIPLLSQYRVILDFDSYPQDVSWFIYNGNNQVVASGGGYGVTVGANTTTTAATINPNDGPFRFVLYDGFDDGFGSGAGSTNNGGSSVLNFIKIIELHANGSVDTIFSKNYAYCTPIYCVGPAASVFGQLDVNLGTPTGTFSTGVSVTLENNRTCTGVTVAGAITTNTDGTGTINTNAAGVNAGSSYSLQYTYTDQYGCAKTICGPLDVFPPITITPTVNCLANPPTVSVNATCSACNLTYIAEFSYDGGLTWTTATTANFQDIFTYAHVKNTITGVVGCEVNSAKLADCPAILPIELIYIKANAIDNQYIKVSWATASEINTSKFEIWRSTDAVNFIKVGELAAAGNSNTLKSYSFDDHNTIGGIVYYYQVREVDVNNHAHLTNIVNAKLDKDKFELISIYPNPAIDNTIITMYSKDPLDVSLSVFNDIGELMRTEHKILKEGLNEWEINTVSWAKGVYYFIINNGEKPITKQVIKLQ